MTEHKHKRLILAWANGGHIQYLQEGTSTWVDCVDNHPSWMPDTEYRVKLPDWQQELVDHIHQGGEVEYAFCGTQWATAEALHWHVEQNTSDYDWAPKACYRKKYLPWQQDLINHIKLGKVVEVKCKTWQPADDLVRSLMTNKTYEWKSKDSYRKQPEPRFAYAYEAQDGHYYISSRLLTPAEATEFFDKQNIKNYQQLTTIT